MKVEDVVRDTRWCKTCNKNTEHLSTERDQVCTKCGQTVRNHIHATPSYQDYEGST